ncbi:SRPBCC domain-containing protein [Amycolatopsis minnesotensis]|uniref:Activator of Hsp90 ATPase homologue 1/2-like C-terminal domain-containing protein n=1 Tax=Amycolatopsis minnesotensis TaxID=337894 RepID=A0ABN2SRH9_9PSEU
MHGKLIPAGGGRTALRFERVLAHPREKVWRALTESGHLRAWFPADPDLTGLAGEKVAFRLTAFPGHEPTSGEIIVSDPPDTLEYTWGDETLRFELTERDGGCLLVFTDVFESREGAESPEMSGAWHAALEVLEARLDGREIGWSVWDRAAELATEYT